MRAVGVPSASPVCHAPIGLDVSAHTRAHCDAVRTDRDAVCGTQRARPFAPCEDQLGRGTTDGELRSAGPGFHAEQIRLVVLDACMCIIVVLLLLFGSVFSGSGIKRLYDCDAL